MQFFQQKKSHQHWNLSVRVNESVYAIHFWAAQGLLY